MAFQKLGETFAVEASSIQSAEAILHSEEITRRFEKFAGELRKIAPKANDFLYFSTAMMTAAEASLYNDDGSIKLMKDGKPVKASWEVGKDGPESMKWVCSDSSIRPYKNNNGDIFPEAELISAHAQWRGKPLCVDHRSNSVDAIRGVVLDTYYDFKSKRVIALCALDKVSYPDLARKVSTGYSTSVSMGTIVEKAICGVDTCNKVARSEKDFCDHMRTKHADGEINCQLKPIELSIVVNPADPSAKIRTIFASVQQLQKHTYSSDVQERMQQIENDLQKVQANLTELKGISGDVNEAQEIPNADPLQISAEWKELFGELKTLKTSMERTLEDLKTTHTTNNEETMTDRDNSIGKQSYYLGGGGVNEPELGKVKYEKEKLNEQLRTKEDRVMLQTKEYGGVEADDKIRERGRPVPERELRRREALQRAKANLTKEGNLSKESYIMVDKDGKLIERKPYEVDKLNQELREKGDRFMDQTGEYGGELDDEVRDLHRPGYAKDELRKDKVVRAGLKARYFRKAASDGSEDVGASGWQIFEKDEKGEKLVFTASVEEISNGQVDQLAPMIATKEFGTKMLEKVREVGVEKAASIYKKAQALPAAPPAASVEAPAGDPTAPSADVGTDVGGADATDDTGKGDKKTVAVDLAEKVRDNASDLLEVVRDITGNQAEMGDLEDGIAKLPAAQASVLAPAVEMRRKLEKMLVSAAKKSLSELKEHYNELKLISDLADEGAVKNASMRSMIDSAFSEAQTALSDSNGVLRSYATYASAVENLQSRVKLAEEGSEDEEEKNADDGEEDEEMDAFDSLDPSFDPEIALHDDREDSLLDHDLGHDHLSEEAPDTLPSAGMENDGEFNDGEMMADDMQNKVEVQLPPGTPAPAPGQPVPANAVVAPKTAADLTTKAGRQAYRLKLADQLGDIEDATKIKYNPILNDAHKDLDQDTGHDLTTKPEGDLARVFTKEEQHKKTLDVATSPVRIQREAARLNALIVKGSVRKEDLDKLVAEGLDAEAVKYWKDYYGTDNAEFAKLLTKEAAEAKAKEEMENYKLKVARTFSLANEMARVGLISGDTNSINRQVEESMGWNDEAFDSFKRLVTKRAAQVQVAKTASTVGQMGIYGDGMEKTASTPLEDLQSELDRCFAGRKY